MTIRGHESVAGHSDHDARRHLVEHRLSHLNLSFDSRLPGSHPHLVLDLTLQVGPANVIQDDEVLLADVVHVVVNGNRGGVAVGVLWDGESLSSISASGRVPVEVSKCDHEILASK